MASDDDVQLPDLQVIQRYSLAVRGATAPRADVVAALEADLAWLRGGRRPATSSRTTPAPISVAPLPIPSAAPTATSAAATKRTPAPVRKTAAKTLAAPAPAKKAPVKAPANKAAAKPAPAKKKAVAKKSGARRR